MPARDGERLDDLLARRDEAGRVGGRVEKDELGRGRDRLFELGRIEAPAAPFVERDGHGAARPEISSAPTKLGQAGVGISASSPGPTMSRVAISIACMPPIVTKKFCGEKAARRGRAVDLRHVSRDRLAQLGNAVLPGVERLAAVERGLRRLADERRRRQVALADP